jgi:hypothetical protein
MPSLTDFAIPVATVTTSLDGAAVSEIDLAAAGIEADDLYELSFQGDNTVLVTLSADSPQTITETIKIGAEPVYGPFCRRYAHMRYLFAASATDVTVTIYRTDMGDS